MSNFRLLSSAQTIASIWYYFNYHRAVLSKFKKIFSSKLFHLLFYFKNSQHLQLSHQITMHFQSTTLLALFTLCLSIGLAMPLADPDMNSSPIIDGPKLESREPHARAEPRGPPNPPSPPPNPGCSKQKPISQNLCTSGSPYCCSGSGASQVCGPASTTSCSSTTICCINTNGVSRCHHVEDLVTNKSQSSDADLCWRD